MPDGTPPNGPRYDEDFYAWTQHQAAVLRSMPCDDNRFDRDHVAEEIEDLGKSERNAVRSEVRRILVHFLKLAHSPAPDPRPDWRESIAAARAELEDRLTPTLRRDVRQVLPRLYARAKDIAREGIEKYGKADAARKFPVICPYTLDQVLDRNWYPEPPQSGSEQRER
ncbi:MAG: DUF29 domain-containing protein [Alphaproteobacteria bacterium]